MCIVQDKLNPELFVDVPRVCLWNWYLRICWSSLQLLLAGRELLWGRFGLLVRRQPFHPRQSHYICQDRSHRRLAICQRNCSPQAADLWGLCCMTKCLQLSKEYKRRNEEEIPNIEEDFILNCGQFDFCANPTPLFYTIWCVGRLRAGTGVGNQFLDIRKAYISNL